jgi:hypothetical protein
MRQETAGAPARRQVLPVSLGLKEIPTLSRVLRGGAPLSPGLQGQRCRSSLLSASVV